VPRIFCDIALQAGASLALPPAAARHVQVLRMQPGDALVLFDGLGGEYDATVERMGRSDVQAVVGEHRAVEREAFREVHLAVGMPANERMDWLVEKATELGVASLQPLMTQHSVLRLSGERAAKKQSHWRSIAIAACEQCGRNRVPAIHPVATLDAWLAAAHLPATSILLSPAGTHDLLHAGTGASAATTPPAGGPASTLDPASAESARSVCVLSGPEGGLSAQEEQAALRRGFVPATLGPRILRAETAPLAALSLLTLA
jgi:16S rRNA (uracil1498-N3)-methyltransferase